VLRTIAVDGPLGAAASCGWTESTWSCRPQRGMTA
jgi:hypothetical protein